MIQSILCYFNIHKRPYAAVLAENWRTGEKWMEISCPHCHKLLASERLGK